MTSNVSVWVFCTTLSKGDVATPVAEWKEEEEEKI